MFTPAVESKLILKNKIDEKSSFFADVHKYRLKTYTMIDILVAGLKVKLFFRLRSLYNLQYVRIGS